MVELFQYFGFLDQLGKTIFMLVFVYDFDCKMALFLIYRLNN
jgi:hypothetical protein